ncbi:MAG: DUF3667 domain-containing protein [Betaproteobacteria bacterium]|nr:DUF3667 domain-containing protein [Betaproteobacteria bacterium]
MSHTLNPSPFCRNCGATLPDKHARFCSSCGQTTHLEIPTFAEFMHELVGHYVALEGKLATTLRALLFSPGKLTRDYFDGRRQRHIPPLRLYLTFSLIFFVVFKLAVNVPVAAPQTPSAAPATVAAEGRPAANAGASPTRESFKKAIVAYGAYAMFFLIPIFTMFLRVLYPRRQLNFGSHLVFAFHVHALFFIAFSIAALLPAGPWLVVGLFVICGAYLQMAMQAVYGGRVYLNLMRLLALFVIYAFCMAITTAGIAGWISMRAAA